MDKRNLLIIIATGVLVTLLITPYLQNGKAIMEPDTQQSSMAKETQINTVEPIPSENSVELVYFWSKYCQYCKKEEPILQEVLGEHPTLKFTRIDMNTEEAIPEIKKYRVMGTPTHVLVDEESTKIEVGSIDKEQLTKFICQKLRDEECGNTQVITELFEGQPEEDEKVSEVVTGGFCP